MNVTKFGVVIILVLAQGVSAQSQTRSVDDLSHEVAELKSQLQSHQALIESQQAQIRQLSRQVELEADDTWLNERRADEIKVLIRQVLEDADTRTSLQDAGLTAGHNGQFFFLSSEDGNYLLRIEGLLQGRFIYNHRSGAPIAGDEAGDEDESGFEIARTKMEFSGHVGSPRLQYLIRIGVDREDNEVLGERVVLGYQLTDSLTLWGGEDKAPFLREEITGPAQQLAVERTLMNEIFTAGYVQGLWMTWHALEEVSLAVSINDGFRSGEADNEENSTNILSSKFPVRPLHKPFFQDRTDFALTARLDFKLAGDWRQWEDFSAWSGEDLALFIGGAIHYELGESGSSRPEENSNFFTWTLDASMEIDSFNIFAAIVGFHSDVDNPAVTFAGNNLDAYGAMIQAGYMVIPDKLEPFIRFEWIDLDGNLDASGKDDQLPIITFGANYYLNRHRAKFTMDLMWVFAQLPDSNSLGMQNNDGNDPTLGALGLRKDRFGDNDQIVFRGQFQLLF